MVLNNEHQYTTSEKSARYTPVVRQEGSVISEEEERLYNKWIDIFKVKIKEKYGNFYNDSKIQKLAQENARYLVTVFMPTQMIYTTSLRQINYIASWMNLYASEHLDKYKKSNSLNIGHDCSKRKLAKSMVEFVDELDKLNVLEEGLMKNEKHRSLSLFGKDLDKKQEYFGDVYITTYQGTFAQLAQAQRHRTLDYQMEFIEETNFFIPPIIRDDQMLVDEWICDMTLVSCYTPQGELVTISESGKYEDFILKCKERLCSAAQLEIADQTKKTLSKYEEALFKSDSSLFCDILKYTKGARCTFPDYDCPSPCGFSEGIQLKRKI